MTEDALTPDEQARRDALAEKILEELRDEEVARERLRIFAAHGDSSNFDQDDAKALSRLVESHRRRIREAMDLRSAIEDAIAYLIGAGVSTPEECADRALRTLRRALED